MYSKMAASRNTGGVDRVLRKCQSCVEAGNFYEAHQMYRTLYFRYSGQKKYTEALNLIYNGAVTLLQHNQHSSGADLAMLMIELLNTSMLQVTDNTTDKVLHIFNLLNADSPEKHNFMIAATRWSMNVSQHKRGHPDLHKKFGLAFWKDKNYSQARYHFIHSTDGQNCALMLIEFHVNNGYSSEVDMFIAQAVLQYLCLQNKDTALVVFTSYTKQHPAVSMGPPYLLPLLNFIWFLLLALEGGKVTVFSILCDKYESSIKRDPTYKEYLDKIGQLFFGLPPPKKNQQGMFGKLYKTIFFSQILHKYDFLKNSYTIYKTLKNLI